MPAPPELGPLCRAEAWTGGQEIRDGHVCGQGTLAGISSPASVGQRRQGSKLCDVGKEMLLCAHHETSGHTRVLTGSLATPSPAIRWCETGHTQ